MAVLNIQAKSRGGAIALLLACLFVSCGNDIEKTKMFERKELPESTIHNAHIQRSEEGRLQRLFIAKE